VISTILSSVFGLDQFCKKSVGFPFVVVLNTPSNNEMMHKTMIIPASVRNCICPKTNWDVVSCVAVMFKADSDSSC